VIIIYRVVLEISVVFGVLSWFFGVILPFFYGFLLAYVLNIPCSGLQRIFGRMRWKFVSKRKKAFGIIGVYLIFILFLFFVLNLVIPQIYNSVSFFAANVQTYTDTALQAVNYIGQQLDLDLSSFTQDLRPENILPFLQGFQINNLVLDTLTNVSTAIFRAFLALVSSIYILVEKESFKGYLRRIITVVSPPPVSEPVFKYAGVLNRNFKQYIYTQTIDGLILGTAATLALWIMGSPYALVLGLMLGLFNYIPYFGSIVATIVAVLVVALVQGLTMAIVAGVVLIVMQQLDANVLQPRLMSDSFSLSPLLVIVSITFGGAIAGIFGMVAAIPITAVLKDLLDTFIAYRARKKAEEPPVEG